MRYRLSAAIVAGLSLAIPGTAQATGWQYCLAFSHADHRTYVTGISVETPGLEGSFAQNVARAGLHIDETQCPRADDHVAMVAMRDDAIAYNREIGMTVVPLPASGFAQVRR
ncbi:MAG: hypothetical protein JSR61_16805 [Proteobacteria bacterium]|nr:hypothetical protein [Pseudomonadota bacterium]